MADDPSSTEIPLPPRVESLIRTICAQQRQSPPDSSVRWLLHGLGEETSVKILTEISTKTIHKSLSACIVYFAKGHSRVQTEESIDLSSPSRRNTSGCTSLRPVNSPNGFSSHSPMSKRPRTDDFSSHSPMSKRLFAPVSSPEGATSRQISPQLLTLSELQFRKAFLILSYIGRRKLEDLMSVEDIMGLKDLSMRVFEMKVWEAFGQDCIDNKDRPKYLDWDSGKTHLYHCHVDQDGNYTFKGPYLRPTRTHLQRELGDDNVLVVKFSIEAKDSSKYDDAFSRIAKEGILVGLKRYRFFVFKDGGKEERKKEKKSPTSSSVKCYFVRVESLAPCNEREPYILSNKTIYEARTLFMHVHMVSSIAKYMARLSLILSTTIKLQVDLGSIDVRTIEDIPCRDANGDIVCNEEGGEPLIHTDGTGFISEDLALKTPKDFSRAKYIKDRNFERFLGRVNYEEKSRELRGSEAHIRDPPLLMQVRLFKNGRAVKGTLLVNRKLPENTIVVRPSMIKVETDSRLSNAPSFNSLEIVGISHKPGRTFLSKNLIALLSYGGVPKEVFLDILSNALEDTQSAYSNKRAALRVALNHGEIDDDFTTARMILSGFPLNEPYLKYRLSVLAKEERKGLKGGKLPVSESFYLMGTTDPTGQLKSDEVCVIMDNGQISGDVLVYRNPGLHFGDIHRLKAVYVEALEDFVGNAKYGIFFSTQGRRSVASEIANGDFDGDMYWVSKNHQLLDNFKVSRPWQRIYSTPDVDSRKPNELSVEDLEHELFQLFKRTRFQQSSPMSVAADSWTAFMDRLLVLGDDCSDEKDHMKKAMHQLVDLYYDALDAPKTGKKVVVPDELIAKKYPHYMERPNSYRSYSVLGHIYNTVVESLQSEDHSMEGVEVWKLPCFDVEIPTPSRSLWSERYPIYRKEMSKIMNSENTESKNEAANDLIKTYKQLLYGAAEFEESTRNIQDIYDEALAIYNLAYDHARSSIGSVKNCGFAWKVAGPALMKLYLMKQTEKMEKPIVCLPSVLREVMN